jgi:hypothetical protein
MSAGAPQLREIAQQRAQKDPHFTNLVVRKVSKENMWIHFTYINPSLEVENSLEVDQLWFKKELETQFGNWIYAYDIRSTDNEKQAEFALIK